jgi:hypothetical protein
MFQQLVHKFNLGDQYERNARLLPAMLVVVPVTTLVIGMDLQHGHWARGIGLGGGLEVLLALLVAKLAQAKGRIFESDLIVKWGSLPTTKWLMPDDDTHSVQQRAKWRQALSKLSGLDLEDPATLQNSKEYRRLLDDAVLRVRDAIRHDKRAELLRQHNISYGFARNLSAIGWLAVVMAGGSFLAAGLGAIWDHVPIPVALIELLFAAIAISFLQLREQYVRHAAGRYAEFFYNAIQVISDAKRTNQSGARKAQSHASIGEHTLEDTTPAEDTKPGSGMKAGT